MYRRRYSSYNLSNCNENICFWVSHIKWLIVFIKSRFITLDIHVFVCVQVMVSMGWWEMDRLFENGLKASLAYHTDCLVYLISAEHLLSLWLLDRLELYTYILIMQNRINLLKGKPRNYLSFNSIFISHCCSLLLHYILFTIWNSFYFEDKCCE